MVLVRPRVRRVEEERLARLVAGLEELVVEPQVDHLDAIRLELHPLDEALLHVPADRDHRAGVVERPAVREPAVEPLGPGEELRVEEVLDVEQAHCGRRLVDPREHDREREVDRVELVQPQLPTEAARAGRRPRSSREAARHRPAGPVRADLLSLEVVHDRRDEDPVLVLAYPVERAHELPRVGLRAAHDARDQR